MFTIGDEDSISFEGSMRCKEAGTEIRPVGVVCRWMISRCVVFVYKLGKNGECDYWQE